MNKHFTITIHDDNGVRQFNLHKFVKRALLYALAFLILLSLIAVGTILYLDYSVDAVHKKKESIQNAYKELELKNQTLKESIVESNERLLQKKEELEELSDSLTEIETLIGITPDKDSSIQERVSVTKMNSQHRATMLQLLPNGSPVEYNGITSKYGYRIHPTLNRREFHRGVDLKAEMNTPVYATADAIVEFSGMHKKSGFGNLVILEHSYGFKTYYGHLKKVVIKSGAFVKKGDLIAYTGNSGMSNGPHLHYEIRFFQRVVNPYWFIKWSVENYSEIFEKEKTVSWQSLVAATAHLKVTKQIPTQQSLQLALKSKGK